MICPVLVRPNQGSGRRCMCENTAPRRSRVMYSCSDAPNCPPPQRKMFLSTTIAMITRTTPRSDAIGWPGTINGPISKSWIFVSHPMSDAIWGCSKSVFRNGISSVNARPSSTAAVVFSTTLPPSLQECGRRNRSRRPYSRISEDRRAGLKGASGGRTYIAAR